METPSTSDLFACAVEAARAAGNHALANGSRRREVAAAFKHDVKLVLDSESQARAEQVIRHHFPSHAIIGEEGDTPAGDAVPSWIVDPIDGTVNFSHGLAHWCSSVAVRVGSRVVAGAVYAPALREMFTASAGEVARCNDRPIRVSDIARASDAIVLTGLEKTFEATQGTLEGLRSLALSVRKVRLMGAAALDICQVAAGRADGFYESGLYLWDVSAGALIVERAGGRAEKMNRVDAQRARYLITNGLIHGELRAVIEGTRASSTET
jgi:myo-inositol-1(or 4)-monophosphatase